MIKPILNRRVIYKGSHGKRHPGKFIRVTDIRCVVEFDEKWDSVLHSCGIGKANHCWEFSNNSINCLEYLSSFIITDKIIVIEGQFKDKKGIVVNEESNRIIVCIENNNIEFQEKELKLIGRKNIL